MKPEYAYSVGVCSVLLSAVLTMGAGRLAAEEEQKLSFRKDIKPILREKCVHCHNHKTLPKEVSFESAEKAFTRTEEGLSFIVPGKPEESQMIIALESHRLHEKSMPMVGERPTKEEIAKLRLWILEGARWPKGWAGRIRPTFYPTE